MGENAHLPQDNGVPPQQNPQEVPPDEMDADDQEENEEFEDISSEDFHVIDSQLDALNSALDEIEQKNDNIHAQLLQLLQSNREIRQEMKVASNPENQQGGQNNQTTSSGGS